MCNCLTLFFRVMRIMTQGGTRHPIVPVVVSVRNNTPPRRQYTPPHTYSPKRTPPRQVSPPRHTTLNSASEGFNVPNNSSESFGNTAAYSDTTAHGFAHKMAVSDKQYGTDPRKGSESTVYFHTGCSYGYKHSKTSNISEDNNIRRAITGHLHLLCQYSKSQSHVTLMSTIPLETSLMHVLQTKRLSHHYKTPLYPLSRRRQKEHLPSCHVTQTIRSRCRHNLPHHQPNSLSLPHIVKNFRRSISPRPTPMPSKDTTNRPTDKCAYPLR